MHHVMDGASRVIMHLDMDAFFASVEQVDQPELQGKPVIVGGSRDRGVVAAASYEARRYGIHSAMPMYTASRLCPQGIFLRGRRGRYSEISRRIMHLLRDYSPLMEPASIDEAYVDLTGTEKLFGPPRRIAEAAKQRIFAEHGLTCSIGLAPNKFVAKIASAWNKPDGITEVPEDQVLSFLQELPLSKLPGVGHKTLVRLQRFNMHCVGDIRRFPAHFWEERLGRLGAVLVQRAWGVDHSPVLPASKRKSCGAENTFARDLSDQGELRPWILAQSEEVGESLRRKGLQGRTVTLKLKFNDFRVLTKSETLAEATDATRTIFEAAWGLLEQTELRSPVRLTGVSVSSFSSPARRLSLFPEQEEERRNRQRLDRAVDAIRKKFGSGALQRASLYHLQQSDDET